ncbi:hypothetical protein BJF81_15935 [Ornithinimicrobium sp. CNJ-824]|uniref:helix-turn-helix domain-containing protein n=1 Tax=Ornithinimicrobium sp. CNJ-824 TaxID=1904966 RepID=UPI00095E0EB6|nr:helix-turn-helix transcriptional regulator [Ornithinimicrobium sp. CNJ-824]OLT20778.1 hypothetical protein BJF81_15935 [Ornithinimicrobium sp. CNJ-824]
MEPRTERQALGQVIRALRELEGLTRQELATRAELGEVMIAKVEQGAKTPSAAALRRIASALGLEAIELSNRGLLWAALQDSPEASTALLRSVATGAARLAAMHGNRGARVALPAAGLGVAGGLGAAAATAGIAGFAYLEDKQTRGEIENALRERLEQRLAEASTPEALVSLAIALEEPTPEGQGAE